MDVRQLDMILGFSWTCLCISTMCNVCLQTVKIRNMYLSYLFRMWWSLIKCMALWRDSLLPPAQPGQWFWWMVPPPPSSGRSYTWFTHLPNHTLGKHEIRPRQKWPVSPHFVCTSGSFSFDFGLQTNVPGRDWMRTKGLHPSFSTHCLQAQSECLPLIQCCFTWWSALVCVMSIIVIIYGLKIPSSGRSAGPQQSSVTSIRSGLSDVVEPEPEFQLFWSHHVLGCDCVGVGMDV